MLGLQSSLYTVALALCVFSTGILSGKHVRAGRRGRVSYFSAYLGIESLGFALELLIAHPESPFKAFWLGLLMGSSLLAAPCLWLALRENLTGERPNLRMLHGGHFLVVAIGILLTLPLISSTHPFTTWVNPERYVSPWHSRAIHATMLGCLGIFGLQVPWYLRRCRELIRDHFDASATASLPHRAWMHLPLIMVGTTWVLGMLRVVQCFTHAPEEFLVLFGFIDVGVTVGALYVILRRTANVTALPPSAIAPPEVATETTVSTPPPASPRTARYTKSSLDPVTRERIRRKLETVFSRERIHCDSLLSLRSLCGALKENPHYVSQVINQDLDSNFYELVNCHRIKHAQQLLIDEPDQTVLDVALAVGFNAKSTFNTAFRRHAGMTPTAYRSQGERKPLRRPDR